MAESEQHSIIIDYLRFHFKNNNNNCNDFDENSKRLKDSKRPADSKAKLNTLTHMHANI